MLRSGTETSFAGIIEPLRRLQPPRHRGVHEIDMARNSAFLVAGAPRFVSDMSASFCYAGAVQKEALMRRTALSLTAFGSALFFASPASAASFDCSRARAADEVTVCHTPSLSNLDSEMGGLWYAYSKVPMLMGGNGNRGDEARAFLDRRRACGRNVACLTRAYRARITDLHRGIDAAMEEFSRLQNE
jgi:hypothetical protein